MEDRSPDFCSRLKQEISKLLYLGLPVIAAQVFMTLMSVVDTLMAGNYDSVHLAAVGIGVSLFGPVIILGGGTLMALNPIIAQHIGARNFIPVGNKVRQALWLSFCMALPSFLVLRSVEPLMVFMNIDTSIIVIADGFLRGISWGVFPVFAFVALRHFNEGLGATRPAMYISMVGFLVNIPANYILIYGSLGFPEIGGIGVGWASTVAYFSMFITMLIYTAREPAYKRFRIFKVMQGPKLKYFMELLKLGFPIGVSRALDRAMFALVALLMGSISAQAMAGHQIAFNFSSLTIMLPFGLATAITVRVGFNAGRKRLENSLFSGFTGIALCICLMIVTSGIIFLFAPFIASLYTSDNEVIPIAVGLLYLVAVYQIFDGLQASGYGALRGIKDTKFPMFVNIIAYWLIGLPVGYFLGFTMDWGPEGMWLGIITGISIAGIMHAVRFYSRCCDEKIS